MRRGRRGLNLDYAALWARYEAGESGTEIARSIGIDHAGLHKSWKRRGYVLRTNSEGRRNEFRMHPERRLTVPAAAQAARRGAIDPIERKEARARTRQARLLGTSPLEDGVASVLDELGVRYIRQLAIGHYNIDFALPELGIALEVDGGGHSAPIRAHWPVRTAYIEARGWRVVPINRRLTKLIVDGHDASALSAVILPSSSRSKMIR